ncbi:hypothetical protein D7030_04885 [Flavobacteriaceae bacterium AU392]|nr:hypothetical protein D1817_11360 [Flavobacteriaceae bacterium]RKM86011.1 hypothetical protein D7030_04885 [Flavobacteriaceae bacterium AU392]
MVYKAYRENEKVEKYRFENRTSGGVVNYDSYEKAKSHRIVEKRQSCAFNIGYLIIVFAGMAFLFFVVTRTVITAQEISQQKRLKKHRGYLNSKEFDSIKKAYKIKSDSIRKLKTNK